MSVGAELRVGPGGYTYAQFGAPHSGPPLPYTQLLTALNRRFLRMPVSEACVGSAYRAGALQA
jgi:hypothetical protein